jgi:hypothetical protein
MSVAKPTDVQVIEPTGGHTLTPVTGVVFVREIPNS